LGIWDIRVSDLFRISVFGFNDITKTPDRQSLLGSHQQSWWFKAINYRSAQLVDSLLEILKKTLENDEEMDKSLPFLRC